MRQHLIPREKYQSEIMAFKSTDLVKVLTGIRRSGKSSLLRLTEASLARESLPGDSFVTINLEEMGLGIKTAGDLHEYCMAHSSPEGKTYLFIDEIQRVEGWHDAVNSLRVSIDSDIYITGSNAFLMSSDIATYLSGRYVEVNVLPLAFSEYATFCGLEETGDIGILRTPTGDNMLSSTLLDRYMGFGGMPAIASLETTQQMHASYMSSLYEAVAERDVLARGRNNRFAEVKDKRLLRTLSTFLSDNVGNLTSPARIANCLQAEGSKTTNKTVQSYIEALAAAYIISPCKRYDLHGKSLLKTNEKYYLIDMGLRSYLDGYRGTDSGRAFENIIYLQLLYMGFTVHVGKLYDKEVDFVCNKDGRVVYVQVADNLFSEKTMERELDPLRRIRDNYEKWVVVRQGSYPENIEGIRIIPALPFLLKGCLQSKV